jgi:hypothetical protein
VLLDINVAAGICVSGLVGIIVVTDTCAYTDAPTRRTNTVLRGCGAVR